MRRPGTVEEYSKIYESEYEAGDKAALIRMLGVCAVSGWIIPKWAAGILDGAHGYAVHGMLKSWDDVFGKPNTPKRGERVRNFQLRWRVYSEILTARAKGESIDDLLFERVGKKLKIGGKTKVKELYRIVRDEWECHSAGK